MRIRNKPGLDVVGAVASHLEAVDSNGLRLGDAGGRGSGGVGLLEIDFGSRRSGNEAIPRTPDGEKNRT